jgi:hypothetical protein
MNSLASHLPLLLQKVRDPRERRGVFVNFFFGRLDL